MDGGRFIQIILEQGRIEFEMKRNIRNTIFCDVILRNFRVVLLESILMHFMEGENVILVKNYN